MKILTIDTSTIVASVAILCNGKLIAETIINHKKKHSEKLMVAIDHLLKDGGLSIKEIDVFGIVSGPGSFTGLRIGMATAKGFAQALEKPLIPVSTLASLAMNIPFSEGVVCPILDAQRNQTYTGLFHFEGQKLIRDLDDSVMEIDELIEILKRETKPIYLLGDGLSRFSKILIEACSNAQIVPPYLNMNRASSAATLVLEKALKGDYQDFKKVEPVYIRPSYAEEKKMKLVYRKMEFRDVAQVQLIDKRCFKHNWSLDAYEKEMDNPLATYIVAEDKDKIIGFGGYWLIIDEAHITNLAVLKAYRKKGIGQQIFDKMAETIAAVGCKKTTLEVREDNFSAIAFYQKNDFVEEGIRFHYYEENSHALIMWRRSYED